jgi:predicted ATPase
MARELGHPFSMADALCYAGCQFNALRRDAEALKENVDALERLSSEKVPAWIGQATSFRGIAFVVLGQIQEGITQIRQGMATCHSVSIKINLPIMLCFLAKAQVKAGGPEAGLTTLDEALTLVEETDERFCEAELHRLKGELLLMQGDEAEAEASYERAIEIARRQGAKSWELRAATSLARLWHKQDRVDEARQMLGKIYDWFTEGFDTPDLKEASALLEELA